MEYPDRVFVLGPQQPTDMILFYQSIDLFVNPTSYYQGLDLTMQEAMACGVPVIASRTGSIEKTIMEPVDGVSAGRTFALGNKRSLYDTILELGKNTTLLKQQARAAAQKAQEDFALPRMLSEYEALFYSLVDAKDKEHVSEPEHRDSSCARLLSEQGETMQHRAGQCSHIWHLSDLVAMDIELHHGITLCITAGSVHHLAALSDEIGERLRVIDLTDMGSWSTFDDDLTRCDLLYHDEREQQVGISENSQWLSLLENLACGGVVFHVHANAEDGQWTKLVKSSTMRKLICSPYHDSSDIRSWCLGSFKSKSCLKSSWIEPEDVDSRADGEYLWSIGIFETSTLSHFDPVGSDGVSALSGRDILDIRGEYLADPFVLLHEGTFMMFFEVWNIDEKRGNIGLATSEDGMSWRYERVVIDEPFHMSYPYVFESSGQYYMIPETHAVRQVRLYHSTTFPFAWKLRKVLLEEDLCDASVVYHDNIWYMFVSPPSNDRVLLYFASDLHEEWEIHPSSPVLEGKRTR